MKLFLSILLILLTQMSISGTSSTAGKHCPPLLDHTVETLYSGETINLCDAYRGQVLVIVNTANKCQLAKQYDALERLQERFSERGLVVLGFHNNDFLGDLDGAPQTDNPYCRLASSIRFPMLAKQSSHPENAAPLFRSLANAAGEYPHWNFHKYVLDRQGNVRGSFGRIPSPIKQLGSTHG